ncbi:MAG: thioredoxin family protein [Desulfatitalea sp.]
MTPHDEQTILRWTAGQKTPATILISRGAGEADARLVQFCDRFKALSAQVRLRSASDEAFRAPALIIGRHQNIAYQAVPEGKELSPFLKAVGAADDASEPSPRRTAPSPRIELPADLTLFITLQCPHCPGAVEQLTALADATRQLRLTIVDGELFAAQAAAHGIRSVPTLILDDHLRWSGPINLAEVIDQCVRRDPALLSAASLRQIIETGEAERLAAMMAERGQIFPALVDLLVHERWSVRLGAMVTVEYLADASADLADGFIAPLWERFAGLAEPVQVDVVQVLAQLKNDTVKQYLEKIASADFSPSARQAAAEELASW